MTMGLSPEASYDEFYNAVIQRLIHPIKPTVVSTGPVKDVKIMGQDVDLLKFPWPYIHEGDGGRYSTMQILAAKDPDSDWVNWANYRWQLHGKRTITLPFFEGQQTSILYFWKYEARGKPMPIAASIGDHPLHWYPSGMPFPPGVSEVDFSGAFAQEPVELVKAETSDLLVPANAEMIIEGEVLPYERAMEGPFGEYVGFMHGPRRAMPVMRVTGITHRKEPIIPFCNDGPRDFVNISTSVSSTLIPIAVGAHLAADMKFPVSKVAISTFMPWSALIVATDVPYPGYVQQLAKYIHHVGVFAICDFVIVVDKEVDPANTEWVMEEIALKAHPVKDFHEFGKLRGPKIHLNVYQTVEEKKIGLTSKVYIDATTKEWDEATQGPKHLNFDTLYPENIRQVVSDKWEKLNFTNERVYK